MKLVKKNMQEHGQTEAEISNFAKYHYTIIAESPDQNNALDEFISNYQQAFPIQESSVEDIME